MRVAILLTLLALLLVPAASANKNLGAAGGHAAAPSGNDPSTRPFPARASAPRCTSAWKAIRWYSARYGHWMALSGHASPQAVSRPHGCAYARWKALRWKERAATARAEYYRWREEHLLHDFIVREGSNAWRHAVAEAQRAYPNTDWWLLSCSSAEGGWGRWVPNSQGSGVGGWLQMYPSTFWRMFSAAKADVEERGFQVPASAASWYSPLGQALGGAWGLTHGRRGEWSGVSC